MKIIAFLLAYVIRLIHALGFIFLTLFSITRCHFHSDRPDGFSHFYWTVLCRSFESLRKREACVLCAAFYSFSIFSLLSLYPHCTLFHTSPPPFSQYGPAQTVGSNPYGTMVTANIMRRISKERERERCSKVKRHFLPGSWCRKVISVVMYSCLGNIRFLTERQTNHDREEEEATTGKLMKKRERTMRRGCWVWMKSLTLALLADS